LQFEVGAYVGEGELDFDVEECGPAQEKATDALDNDPAKIS